MLVLTRKTGESICIGEEVEVRIVSVHGHKVRLAIAAPRDIAVRRSELPPEPGHGGLRLSGELEGERRRRAVS